MVTRIPIWLRVLGERIMRIKSYVDGGHAGQGIFTSQGASLTGPLILAGDPVEPMEATSKQYVDQNNQDLISQGVTAEGFVKGGVAPAVLPAFSGDVSNVQGSNVFNLPESGVMSGTYPKVEVNAKGLVVDGGSLLETDIPTLPWGKITSGRPTSVSGLGIEDLLGYEGGELTGLMEAHADPVSPKNPSTVGYIRGKAETYPDILQVGDIIEKPTIVTPFGFLKANGGLVSKEMYADLYAVIGDKFNNPLIQSNSRSWSDQYNFNFETNGNLDVWTEETPFPFDIRSSTLFTVNDYVYIKIGQKGLHLSDEIYRTKLIGGNLSTSWELVGTYPLKGHHSTVVVFKDKVYLIGNGWQQTTNKIYSSSLNSDGSISSWTVISELPYPITACKAVIYNNRLYVIGGWTGANSSNKIISSALDYDGNLLSWREETHSLEGLTGVGVCLINNKLYLFGGSTYITDVSPSKKCYYFEFDENGSLGEFTQVEDLPEVIGIGVIISTNKELYFFGGAVSEIVDSKITNDLSNKIYKNTINNDGTINDWNLAGTLPVKIDDPRLLITSKKLYIIGGTVENPLAGGSRVATSKIYSTPFQGGKDNYNQYFNEIKPTDIYDYKFRLPEFINNPKSNIYTYLKY
ncbi:putative tail fiber protein [Bacillus phage vB_BspM_AgentSmith]|nr:putative tail fiber protein [Bacillus phage vB_BspM_AgentSmith]